MKRGNVVLLLVVMLGLLTGSRDPRCHADRHL